MTSYLVSFYTTKLLIDATKADANFCITLKKYFGMKGYYMGIIAPALLMLGAMTALFVILSQLLYPILLALWEWIVNRGSEHPKLNVSPEFDEFSSAYTAIILYFLLTAICSK